MYLAFPLCTKHCECQVQSIFVSKLCMNERICSRVQFLFAFSYKSPMVREPRASARRTHEVLTIPLIFIAVHTIRLLALETFRFWVRRREVRHIIHYLFPHLSFVFDKSQPAQAQAAGAHSRSTMRCPYFCKNHIYPFFVLLKYEWSSRPLPHLPAYGGSLRRTSYCYRRRTPGRKSCTAQNPCKIRFFLNRAN